MNTALHETSTGYAPRTGLAAGVRSYFASDARRTIQTVLGLVWLLDGFLQFQPFMYSHRFIQMITGMESGQPHWLSVSIGWGARIEGHELSVWNTLFALAQVAVGVGLLYRPTVKLALAASFAWALVVWWLGEAFGMLFANAANPLTGAPGAVLLYGLIGLLVWPNGRLGGLLGVRGARIMWAALWIVFGYLWLLAPNSSANATSGAITSAPTGMHWLTRLLVHAGNVTAGNGLLIAIILAAVSIAIGVAVGARWHSTTFLWLAIFLSALYWVFGQGFGGLATGSATDPNSGPLLILLACALLWIVRGADDERNAVS